MNVRIDSMHIRVPAALASQGKLIARKIGERIAANSSAAMSREDHCGILHTSCTVQRHAPADAIAASVSRAIVKKIERAAL